MDMMSQPKILIVDDEPFNVDYLEQELEDLGYVTVSAFDGREALEQVEAESPDMILLDIMMPLMDGFEVLERLKADKHWREIPVVVISAMDDVASIVKGIELGAEDYLSKPFDPILLQARLSAGLEKKQLRDQEIEYLEQVERLTDAARAVESDDFEPESLAFVALRSDALGDLARVFQRMAQEVHAREQRLRQQLEQLRLDVEEQVQGAKETADVYIPMDRRHSLVSGRPLPERTKGAALFVDISGFTPLTEALARELGRERGAEELVRHLNQVYGALIDQVHRFGGCVIGFSGDAITCWFDLMDNAEQTALRATACALAMQEAIDQLDRVTTSGGSMVSFAAKAAVVAGPARRLLVGDPQFCKIEILAGRLLDDLSLGEHLAGSGEVLIQEKMAEQLADQLLIDSWRSDVDTGKRYAVINSLLVNVPHTPWPDLPLEAIPAELAKTWLLPPVYEQVQSGRSHFLAELRIATALFLSFDGIDYDEDHMAGKQLDDFVRWVQAVLERHSGYLIQVTTGDKGSYLYASFGAPVTLTEEKTRAINAALDLQIPPPELNFIDKIQIGIAAGQMRAGAYGSVSRRTYGVMGNKANLAARLMQVAGEGILCEESVYQDTRDRFDFEPLPPMKLKGVADPVAIYMPSRSLENIGGRQARLVGRTAEQDILSKNLNALRRGLSKIILIDGQAGLGKSRLADYLREQSEKMEIPVYEGRGSAAQRFVSLHAWRDIFDQVNVPTNGTISESSLTEEDTLSMLGQGDWIGQRFVQRLQKSLGDAPAVFIFEDAHWLDPASWKLALLVSQQVQSVLLLILMRPLAELPDAAGELIQAPNSDRIRLSPLSSQDIRELLSDVLGVERVSDSVVELIYQEADGNPLYSEQLAYIIRDNGIITLLDGEYQVAPDVDLRSELYSQSLAEAVRDRFDRLPAGPLLTLKVASVIGPFFRLDLLQAIYPVEADRGNLFDNLRLLEERGLTIQVATEPADLFEFKNTVIQETAYDLMLYAQRRQLHRAIAEWYENGDDDDLAVDYPLLAHHWGKAEDMAKTIYYLEKAGEEARHNGDFQGAQRFLNQALSLDVEAAVLSPDYHTSVNHEDSALSVGPNDNDDDRVPGS